MSWLLDSVEQDLLRLREGTQEHTAYAISLVGLVLCELVHSLDRRAIQVEWKPAKKEDKE